MVKTYLQLVRPANVLTAVTDVLAGAALAGALFQGYSSALLYLCFSTACLYAGGIVFNDFFDADLDAVERPERAIPSGKVSLRSAFFFGVLLFVAGVAAAFQVSSVSGYLAVGIVVLCLLYDKFSKHHSFFGPVNMGLCRGVNLVLGMSLLPAAGLEYYYYALFPVLYIAAITAISRGEVHGGSRRVLYMAGLLYLAVSAVQLGTAWRQGEYVSALPFVLLHLYLICKPLLAAVKAPVGPNISKAVKAGVLGLIAMNAAWISVSGHLGLAVAVLLLLPVSLFLAKYFAVT